MERRIKLFSGKKILAPSTFGFLREIHERTFACLKMLDLVEYLATCRWHDQGKKLLRLRISQESNALKLIESHPGRRY
jgi:hypothetical protein